MHNASINAPVFTTKVPLKTIISTEYDNILHGIVSSNELKDTIVTKQ